MIYFACSRLKLNACYDNNYITWRDWHRVQVKFKWHVIAACKALVMNGDDLVMQIYCSMYVHGWLHKFLGWSTMSPFRCIASSGMVFHLKIVSVIWFCISMTLTCLVQKKSYCLQAWLRIHNEETWYTLLHDLQQKYHVTPYGDDQPCA